jgi:phospholipase/carboxylesterase
MSVPSPLAFVHRYVPGRTARTLLLLHGTGGNENDLLSLGRGLDPTAALLSPRGKVLENGMPRFFRRLAEGVFDEQDLIRRTHELADFVGEAAERYQFDAAHVVAIGYSNGANIAGGILLMRPGVISGAALLRPMVPLIPQTLPELKAAPVLVSAGNQDPIVPAENARELVALLRRAGADVTVCFENAGHALTDMTLATTQRWLAEKATARGGAEPSPAP